MKLTKTILSVLLLATISIFGCKSKSAKELIVNKWKLTNISGGESGQMADSIKTQLYNTATMEFMKDGKYEMTMTGRDKGGIWKISDDGKTLTTSDADGSNSEDAEIVEISADKCIVKNKKDNTTITMAKK